MAEKDKISTYMEKNFEWLTKAICNEYIQKANTILGSNGEGSDVWRNLRAELQKRCNITELEAGNILRNRNVNDYLVRYGILSGEIPMTEAMKKRLEKQKKGKKDDLDEYRERIADLESLLKVNRVDDYGFEERD